MPKRLAEGGKGGGEGRVLSVVLGDLPKKEAVLTCGCAKGSRHVRFDDGLYSLHPVDLTPGKRAKETN